MSPESYERPANAAELAELDIDWSETQKTLGALGIYDASHDIYRTPEHNDDIWHL